MTEKLPKGWVDTTLGQIVEPSRERALPTEVPEMRYVGLEHIESQTMKLVGYKHAYEVRSSSILFSKGDVLYAKMRPYLNKVWLAEFDGLCSPVFLEQTIRAGLSKSHRMLSAVHCSGPYIRTSLLGTRRCLRAP